MFSLNLSVSATTGENRDFPQDCKLLPLWFFVFRAPFTIPIWTKHLQYKEYFWGTTCGIIWYSKSKSAKYKNLKIGNFAIIFNPIGTFWQGYLLQQRYLNIENFCLPQLLYGLIPNLAFFNIKYKYLEMSFFSLDKILCGVFMLILSVLDFCNNEKRSGFIFLLLCPLSVCLPERIAIDFSCSNTEK